MPSTIDAKPNKSFWRGNGRRLKRARENFELKDPIEIEIEDSDALGKIDQRVAKKLKITPLNERQ